MTVRRGGYHDLVDEKADLYRTAQGSEVQLHRRTKSAGQGSIPQRASRSIKGNFRSLMWAPTFEFELRRTDFLIDTPSISTRSTY